MGKLFLSWMPSVPVFPFLGVLCNFSLPVFRLLYVSLESDLQSEVHVEEHQPCGDDEGQAETGAVRDVEQRQQEILPGDTTHCVKQKEFRL